MNLSEELQIESDAPLLGTANAFAAGGVPHALDPSRLREAVQNEPASEDAQPVAAFSTACRIARNLFGLIAARFLAALGGLISSAYLARVLGPEAFGLIGWAMSCLTFFTLFVSFGLDVTGIIRITRNKESISTVLSEIVVTRLFLAAISLGLNITLVLNLAHSAEVKVLFLILSVLLLVNVISLDWVYQGLERTGTIASRQCLMTAASLALFFIFVKHQGDLPKVAMIQVLSLLLTNVWLLVRCKKEFGLASVALNRVAGVLKSSAPIAASSILIMLYYQADIVLLGWMRTPAETGFYSAAYKIVFLLGALQGVVNASIFPTLGRLCAAENSEHREEFVNALMLAMSRVGILICHGVVLAAPLVSGWLYGNQFAPSVPLLQILTVSMLLVFNETVTAPLLLAQNRKMEHLACVGFGAITNFGLNLAVIPRYGATGAAFVMILTEILVCISLMLFVGHSVRLRLFHIFWPLAASAWLLVSTLGHFRHFVLINLVVLGVVLLLSIKSFFKSIHTIRCINLA
jgi:O-antigen/teichoic acid export membrane protein